MQQQSANQKAKPGRKPRPAVQLTRIRKETIETVDRLCAALNTLRGPRDAVAARPHVIAEIIARYGAAYLADRAQDAARRAQAALQGAQDAAPASATPAPPADPLPAVDIEDALERAFWAYDQEHKRSGEERLTWKKYVRAAFGGQHHPPRVYCGSWHAVAVRVGDGALHGPQGLGDAG